MDEIKKTIFKEADNACALCGQKGIENLTEHHIDGNEKNNQYDNLIILCWNCHYRFHQKKGISKEQIINEKHRLIEKTLTIFGVNALKISERNNFGIVATPFLLFHLVSLGFLKQKEKISSLAENGIEVDSEVLFEITEQGKKLIKKWF
jgi:hypothetical protein